MIVKCPKKHVGEGDEQEPSMSLSLDELLARANAGEVDAQRELAVRLHNGDGVARNEEAARSWLRVAAENGDAWSQTMLGDVLRVSKGPDYEREAVHWYARAAGQGAAHARFMLGCLQLHGEGTDVDIEAAAVNLMMASLSGHDEAKVAIQKMRPALSPEFWASISARVSWAQLTFVMGKSVDSVGPGGIAPFQTEDDWGADNSLWLQDEQEAATATFHPDARPCILDAAFGAKVTIRKFHVGRAIVAGEKVFATTISLQHILQPDLTPVWWKPSLSILEDTATAFALIQGRQWIRSTYTSY